MQVIEQLENIRANAGFTQTVINEFGTSFDSETGTIPDSKPPSIDELDKDNKKSKGLGLGLAVVAGLIAWRLAGD